MKPLAPAPVHYRLAPGGGLFLVLAVLLLALGGVLLAWLLALRQAQQEGVVVIGLITAVAYALASWLSWRTARALPSGWLVWNGKCWQWQQAPRRMRALPISVGQEQGQMGARASVRSPGLCAAGVASAVTETACTRTTGAPPVAAYTACTLVLDWQWAVLLRLHGRVRRGTEQAMEQEPGRRTRSRWVGWRQPKSDEAASAICLWASRASDPAHWQALRCALVWAQAQGPQEWDLAAGGPAAPAARATEVGQASEAAAGVASATQPGPAGEPESALAESAFACAAAPSPGRGAS